MKKITLEERLVVAVDFSASLHLSVEEVRLKTLKLAEHLEGTGVCIKINSGLRACGYKLINEIGSYGMKVFADLKLYDIDETLSSDAALLEEARPDILTISCSTSLRHAHFIKKLAARDVEVLGVTVLTSMTEKECVDIHGRPIIPTVLALAMRAKRAGLGGVVASAKEAELIRGFIGRSMSINTPGIRPKWYSSQDDDQNPRRTATPKQALQVGADRLIIGRPIMEADSPRDAVMRTLDEMSSALP